eukprot:2439743-Rhodomonas_salina.3
MTCAFCLKTAAGAPLACVFLSAGYYGACRRARLIMMIMMVTMVMIIMLSFTVLTSSITAPGVLQEPAEAAAAPDQNQTALLVGPVLLPPQGALDQRHQHPEARHEGGLASFAAQACCRQRSAARQLRGCAPRAGGQQVGVHAPRHAPARRQASRSLLSPPSTHPRSMS